MITSTNNDEVKNENARIQDALAREFSTEKIVYLLGAGFSAPLGLPVMKEFYGKAQDLQKQTPHQFRYFDKVFEFARRTGQVASNYKSTDIYNIEETLSMLDMQDLLDETNLGQDMKNFISAVIHESTPEVQAPSQQPSNPMDSIFWEDRWYPYGAFISAIFHVKFRSTSPSPNGWHKLVFDSYDDFPQIEYSVITLNYDRVLETMCEFLNSHYQPINLQFLRSSDPYSRPLLAPGCAYLAKLHGSEGEEIILPTWRKDLNDKLLPTWRLARNLLRNANQIRIVGYSLPAYDAYIKELLRVAAIDGSYLKHIDVLCYDPDGDVETRYREFIGNNARFRFKKGRSESLFWNHIYYNSWGDELVSFDNIIENQHRLFFS